MAEFNLALVAVLEPTLGAELAGMLNALDFQTVQCTTPAAPFDQLPTQCALVVLDAQLEVARDYLSLAALRDQWPGVLVLVVGEPDAAHILASLRARADDYLPLPLDATELARMLAAHRNWDAQAHAALNDASIERIQTQSLALMSRLAANMAHEINNPLTPILGLAELLRNDATPGTPLAQAAETIIASALRITGVLQSLMTFTHPMSRRDRFDLRELVRETVQTMAILLDEQRVTVDLHLPSEPVQVEISVAEVKQALFLLIDHARQAMPQGGTLTLDVGLEQPAAGPQQATVRISDTGTSLPSYHLPNLFEPFYSHAPLGTGSGLGLAIARRVAKLHGGQVAFEPGGQRGNLFRFSLLADS